MPKRRDASPHRIVIALHLLGRCWFSAAAEEESPRRAEPGGRSRVGGVARDDAGGDQRAVVVAQGRRPEADGGGRQGQGQPAPTRLQSQAAGKPRFKLQCTISLLVQYAL